MPSKSSSTPPPPPSPRPPMVIRHYFDEPALPESPLLPLRPPPSSLHPPSSSPPPLAPFETVGDTTTPDNPHHRSTSGPTPVDPGLFDYVAYLSPPSPPRRSASASPAPSPIDGLPPRQTPWESSPTHLSPISAAAAAPSLTTAPNQGKRREPKVDPHGRPAHPVQADLYAAHGRSPVYTTASDFSSLGGQSDSAWDSSPDAAASALPSDPTGGGGGSRWPGFPGRKKGYVWKRGPEEEAMPRLEILHDPQPQSPPEKYASLLTAAGPEQCYDDPDEEDDGPMAEERRAMAGSPSSMLAEAASPFPGSRRTSDQQDVAESAIAEKKDKGKGKVSSWFSRKKASGAPPAAGPSPTSPNAPAHLPSGERKRSIFALARSRTKSVPRSKGKGKSRAASPEEETRSETMEEREERMRGYSIYIQSLRALEDTRQSDRLYGEGSKSMIDLSAPLPPVPGGEEDLHAGGFTEKMKEAMARERERLPEKFREGFDDLNLQEAALIRDLAESDEEQQPVPPKSASQRLSSLNQSKSASCAGLPTRLSVAGASISRSAGQKLRPSTSTGSLVPSSSLFSTQNPFAKSTSDLVSTQRDSSADRKRLTAHYGWMADSRSPTEKSFAAQISAAPPEKPRRPMSSSERIHAAASSRTIIANTSLSSDTSKDGLRVLDLEGNFPPKVDEIGRLVEESESSPEAPRMPTPPPPATLPIPPKSTRRPGTALRNLRIDTSKIGPAFQKLRQSATSATISSDIGKSKNAGVPRSASETYPFFHARPSESDVAKKVADAQGETSFSSSSSAPQSRSSSSKLARMLGPEYNAAQIPPLIKTGEGGKEVRHSETRAAQPLEMGDGGHRLSTITPTKSKTDRKASLEPPTASTPSKAEQQTADPKIAEQHRRPSSKLSLSQSQTSQPPLHTSTASKTSISVAVPSTLARAGISSSAKRRSSTQLSSSVSAPLVGAPLRKGSAVSTSSSLPVLERGLRPPHPFAVTVSPFIAEKVWRYRALSFLDLAESPPSSPENIPGSNKRVTIDFSLQILQFSGQANIADRARRASLPLVDLSFLDNSPPSHSNAPAESANEEEQEANLSEASGVNTTIPPHSGSRSRSASSSPRLVAASSPDRPLAPTTTRENAREESPTIPPSNSGGMTSTSVYLHPPSPATSSFPPDLGDQKGGLSTIRRPSIGGIFARRKSDKSELEDATDTQVDPKRVMDILAGRAASSQSTEFLVASNTSREGLPSLSSSLSKVSFAEGIPPPRQATSDKLPKEIWYPGEHDRELAIYLSQTPPRSIGASQYPEDPHHRAEVQRVLAEFPTNYEQIKTMPHEEIIVLARVLPSLPSAPSGLGEKIGSRFRKGAPGAKWQKVHLVLTHMIIRHLHPAPPKDHDEEWMKDIPPRHQANLNAWKTGRSESIMHLHLFPLTGEITSSALDGMRISDEQKREISRRWIDSSLKASLGRMKGPEVEYGEPRVRRSVVRVNWGVEEEGDWYLEFPADRAEMWVELINDYARMARKEKRDLARYQKSLLDASSASAYDVSRLHKKYGLPGCPKHPGDHNYVFNYDNCDEETYIARAMAAGYAFESEACRPPISIYPPPPDWVGADVDWENPIWRMTKEKGRREEGAQLPHWNDFAWEYPTSVGRKNDGNRLPATSRLLSLANRKHRKADAAAKVLMDDPVKAADRLVEATRANQAAVKKLVAEQSAMQVRLEDLSPLPITLLSLPPSTASHTSALPHIGDRRSSVPRIPHVSVSRRESTSSNRTLPPPFPPPTGPLPPLPKTANTNALRVSLNLETPRQSTHQAKPQPGPKPATLNLIRAFPSVPTAMPSMERLYRALSQSDEGDETPRAPGRLRPANVLHVEIPPASLQAIQGRGRSSPLLPTSSLPLLNSLIADKDATVSLPSSTPSSRSLAASSGSSIPDSEQEATATVRPRWKKPRSAGAVGLNAEINALDEAAAAEHALTQPSQPVYDPSKRAIRFGERPESRDSSSSRG